MASEEADIEGRAVAGRLSSGKPPSAWRIAGGRTAAIRPATTAS
ncbi:hypothetical protein [Pleomorphomonas sp. JP5]|nr:hypothetical protein [Pleomorphomonas sp. JP5]